VAKFYHNSLWFYGPRIRGSSTTITSQTARTRIKRVRCTVRPNAFTLSKSTVWLEAHTAFQQLTCRPRL